MTIAKISHCALCAARFLDQQGLTWHHQASHTERQIEMFNEIETDKSRVLAMCTAPKRRGAIMAFVVMCLGAIWGVTR